MFIYFSMVCVENSLKISYNGSLVAFSLIPKYFQGHLVFHTKKKTKKKTTQQKTVLLLNISKETETY